MNAVILKNLPTTKKSISFPHDFIDLTLKEQDEGISTSELWPKAKLDLKSENEEQKNVKAYKRGERTPFHKKKNDI